MESAMRVDLIMKIITVQKELKKKVEQKIRTNFWSLLKNTLGEEN